LAAMAREAAGAGAEAGDPGRGVERAITGPVARGDFATFLREIERLRSAPGEAAGGRLELYCRLALETVRLTRGGDDAERLARALGGGGFLDPPGGGC
ncbi:MAG TPA: hypothetical protein VM599_00635, partial [Thermoanaerobaculia bacterium]|nr:hypothetical protein [Thermoanaerobaculia bacterium]